MPPCQLRTWGVSRWRIPEPVVRVARTRCSADAVTESNRLVNRTAEAKPTSRGSTERETAPYGILPPRDTRGIPRLHRLLNLTPKQLSQLKF